MSRGMAKLAGVSAAVVLLFIGGASPAQAAAQRSAALTAAGSDWGSSPKGQAVQPLWAFEACAGEFMSSNVAAGGFVWGGEQSCTESSPQTLEFILENVTQGGDNLVGAPFKSWTGYQNYIHTTTTCQSSKKTLYREYAYGTANGVSLQPYPATKGFYLNCYHAGEKGGCSAVALAASQGSIAGRPVKPTETPDC